MATDNKIRPREGLPKLGRRNTGPFGPRGGRSEELRTHGNASPEQG